MDKEVEKKRSSDNTLYIAVAQNGFDDSNIEIEEDKNQDVPNLDKKYLVLRISKKYKISVRKALIPLRIALFCWYGAAWILLSFLSAFTKQRGLPLVEFASTNSASFVLKFLSMFVSGMVADKYGNVKPVLLFHLLVTLCSVISLILAPRVIDCSQICSENQSVNSTSNIGVVNENLEIAVPYHLNKDSLDYLNARKSFPRNDTFSRLVENCTTTKFSNSEAQCATENKNKIIYIILILLFFISHSCVYIFMDLIIVRMVKLNESNYGREHCFALFSDILVTLLSGCLMNLFTPEGGANNYEVVYYFSAFLICCTLFGVICVNDTTPTLPGRNLWKKTFQLSKNMDCIVLALILLVMGSSLMFTESYLVLLLEHLHARPIMYGLLLAVDGLYGLPFLFTSDWWLKMLGEKKLFVIALVCHAIRGGLLSLINNAWYAMGIQTTSIFVYHLLSVSLISYVQKIAPEGLLATSTSIFMDIHYSMGNSSGVFFGGMLMNFVGIQPAFMYIACFCLMTAVLYSIFLYCRRSSENVNSEDVEIDVPKIE